METEGEVGQDLELQVVGETGEYRVVRGSPSLAPSCRVEVRVLNLTESVLRLERNHKIGAATANKISQTSKATTSNKCKCRLGY